MYVCMYVSFYNLTSDPCSLLFLCFLFALEGISVYIENILFSMSKCATFIFNKSFGSTNIHFAFNGKGDELPFDYSNENLDLFEFLKSTSNPSFTKRQHCRKILHG